MNTKTVGELSEAIILTHLMKKGYSVSIPFGNSQRYDFIVDTRTELLRAQCKTGRIRKGCVNFSVASRNAFTRVRKTYHGEIDVFLVYCPCSETIYQIPVNLTGKSEMNLRVDKPNGGGHSQIRWAKDFLI